MSLRIAPSLMSADLLDLRSELRALDPYADYYHVDIIDWHYVKNMCLTPQFIGAMRAETSLPIEAHLYVDNVDEALIETCLDAGANIVTMPADVISRSVNRFSRLIHDRGARVGVFLNPAQRVEEIEPYAQLLDTLLILSVDPGFGGQNFIPSTYARIERAVEMRSSLSCRYQIALDGNCDQTRFLPLARAGADALSLGRGLFERDANTRRAAELTRLSLDEVDLQLGKR